MENSPENPFAVPPRGGPFLALDHYQSIHYHAVRAAVHGAFVRACPDHLSVADLKASAQQFGSDAYLRHPEEIRLLFAGVTGAVFEAVQVLYCSRLGLSMGRVWKILCAMADAARTPPPPYEAIWALCLYFEEARRAQIAVAVERGAETWGIAILSPNIHVARKRTVTRERWSLVCCADLAAEHVLAFRCVPETDVQSHLCGILYDALVAQRRPRPSVPTGVLWHIPKRLAIASSVPQDYQSVCQQMGVMIERVSTVPPMFVAMEEAWGKELAGQVISDRSYALLFDTLLQEMHGHGPRRIQREREQNYRHLRGYSADPAWQFPLLRTLLTSHSASITAEGVINFNDLQYTHPLLRYWPENNVTLLMPVETYSRLWVYVENEVLCQASAQELRGRDARY